MGEENYTFEDLTAVLPGLWRAKAKELGALQRAREIKTPEDLLKLIFLYLTEGKSFRNTSALLSMSESYHLPKKAIYTRMGNRAEWLRWLCEHLCRENRMLAEKPAWLLGKKVYLADVSDESVYGSSKIGFRLHYSVGLFDLGMKELRLTDGKTGEKLSKFQRFGKDDLVIADRAYGTIAGIEYLTGCRSEFLLRYRTGAFNLYTGEQERVEVTDFFQGLEPGTCGAVVLYYKLKEEYKLVRLRKTEEAEMKGIERLKAMNRMKSHGKPLGEAQLANNRYVIVTTSLLEVDTSLILQLYRFRWQIELVFKRLRTCSPQSLFGYNQILSKVDVSAKAWFYGKLLLAAFCETWANKARFSPLPGQPRPLRPKTKVSA
jgi:hypothetical protein